MEWLARLLLVVALVGVVSGCERQRWRAAEPGRYTQIRGSDDVSNDAARELHSLTVYRRTNDLLLIFADGSEQVVSFTTRQREAWPAGCPTNLVQHRMEVLDLTIDTITIGDWSVDHPILVRNCPGEPEELVLCEEAPVGGGGSAVRESCLFFAR